jgi:hypothetical protein
MPSQNFKVEVKGPKGSDVEKAVDKAMKEGMEQLRNEMEMQWMRHAQMKLKTTSKQFMDGVNITQVPDGIDIEISGWLPVALETGAPSFDMKPGLLGNRSSRVIKLHDGEFRTVSKNSPQDSWIHPGFESRNIHEAVEAEADDMIKASFGPAFERIKV